MCDRDHEVCRAHGRHAACMTETRAKTRIPAVFRTDGVKGTGKVRNISEGGLFVGTRAIPDQGHSVRIMLTPPNYPAIEVTGFVWWTTRDHPSPQERPGCGIRVLDDNEQYRRLELSLS